MKDAAARWVLYATSPEGGLQELSVKSGMIPARRSTAAGTPWDGYPFTVFSAQMERAFPYQYPNEPIPQMAQIEVRTIQTAIQAMALGQKTADEAALAICSEIDGILKKRPRS